MPVRLLMWFCRVALRFMIAQAWGFTTSDGLKLEAQELLKDLTKQVFPAGAPEAYR